MSFASDTTNIPSLDNITKEENTIDDTSIPQDSQTLSSNLESGLESNSNLYINEDLNESNDLTVLRSEMSSDEFVNESDIINTDEIIKQGRYEDEEIEEEELENANQISINLWEIIKKSSINLVLPFINGLMLGFGEILAHEIGFRYNWIGAKVSPPRRIIAKNRDRDSKFL